MLTIGFQVWHLGTEMDGPGRSIPKIHSSIRTFSFDIFWLLLVIRRFAWPGGEVAGIACCSRRCADCQWNVRPHEFGTKSPCVILLLDGVDQTARAALLLYESSKWRSIVVKQTCTKLGTWNFAEVAVTFWEGDGFNWCWQFLWIFDICGCKLQMRVRFHLKQLSFTFCTACSAYLSLPLKRLAWGRAVEEKQLALNCSQG